MKRKYLCVLASLLLASAVVGGTTVLDRLGIKDDVAKERIFLSVQNGVFIYPAVASLKLVPVEERAALVELIGQFSRTYLESQDFAVRYQRYRENQRPQEPESQPSAEAQKAEQKVMLQETLARNEAMLNSSTAEDRKMYEGVIDALKEAIDSLDQRFGSDFQAMLDQSHRYDIQSYQKELADWEQKYPADPKDLIALRLQEFLEQSEGVDFDAQLQPGPDKKMIFVNPVYEKKPANWKLAYRAGRETVDAARAFARQWLDEISARK